MGQHLYQLADIDKNDAIVVVEGLARRILPEELENPIHFYKDLDEATANPAFDIALEHRINKPLAEGTALEINPNPAKGFENRKNRKVRMAGVGKTGDTYVFALGPCHFGETQVSNIASFKDDALYERLVSAGKSFGDEAAYFANNVAVNVSILSSDGIIPVFKRKMNAEILPGGYHVIGGMVDLNAEDLFRAEDPSGLFLQRLERTARAELIEEKEFDKEVLRGSYQLTGLFNMAFTSDFTYHVLSSLGIDDLLSKKKIDRSQVDHDEVLLLEGPAGVAEFLRDTKREIMPSCIGNLLVWLKRTDKTSYENALDALPERYGKRYRVL